MCLFTSIVNVCLPGTSQRLIGFVCIFILILFLNKNRSNALGVTFSGLNLHFDVLNRIHVRKKKD